MDPTQTNPKHIAEMGEKIYADRYKTEFEKLYRGQFVAIDVSTAKAYRGATPQAAFAAARQASPNGLFHLIRIGQPGAFRVSYSSSPAVDWVFR